MLKIKVSPLRQYRDNWDWLKVSFENLIKLLSAAHCFVCIVPTRTVLMRSPVRIYKWILHLRCENSQVFYGDIWCGNSPTISAKMTITNKSIECDGYSAEVIVARLCDTHIYAICINFCAKINVRKNRSYFACYVLRLWSVLLVVVVAVVVFVCSTVS